MIFQRAALREFASTAAALFVGLSFIMVTVVLIRFLSQAAGGQVPIDAVLALIGFTSLNWMPVALSLAVFISILLTITRVWRDSEMVVWFASGLPLTAWIGPILRFALPVVVLIGVLSLYLSPWAQQKAAEYRKVLESRDEVSRVAPGVFREIASAQRIFYVEAVIGEAAQVKNIFIASHKPGKQSVTVASQGHTETAENGDRFIVMENGRRYEGEPGSAEYRVTEFERYALRIEPKEVGQLTLSSKTTPTQDLIKQPTPPNMGELLRRVTLPLAALVLALLALPLSFVNPRGGRAYSLIFAVLVFTVYFNLIGIAQAWVAQSKLPFLTTAWAIHVPMLCILLLLLWRQLNPNRRSLWQRVRGTKAAS